MNSDNRNSISTIKEYEAWLAGLYEEYYDRIAHYVYVLIGNRAEAEDIAGEFFLKALKILNIEEFLRERGVNQVWGMIGGSCALCDICRDKTGELCIYPDKARMSLEAIAVDVVGLLDKFGLDSKFHADKITWTGCILF